MSWSPATTRWKTSRFDEAVAVGVADLFEVLEGAAAGGEDLNKERLAAAEPPLVERLENEQMVADVDAVNDLRGVLGQRGLVIGERTGEVTLPAFRTPGVDPCLAPAGFGNVVDAPKDIAGGGLVGGEEADGPLGGFAGEQVGADAVDPVVVVGMDPEGIGGTPSADGRHQHAGLGGSAVPEGLHRQSRTLVEVGVRRLEREATRGNRGRRADGCPWPPRRRG